MRCRCLIAMFVTALAGCNRFGRDLSPIRLEPIVTLGASSGEGAIATTPVISAHHPGGFWVVTPASSAIGTLPLVYGDDGGFLGSLRGDGTPNGSFSGPVFTEFGPGDSIWVFDNSGRVLIFGPNRNYVRTITLPAAPAKAHVLADGRFLATYASDSVVKLLDGDGSLVRDIHPQHLPPDNTKLPFMILVQRDGTFWTWQRSDLPLEQWDTSGRRLRAIDRYKDTPFRSDSVRWKKPLHHEPPTVQGPGWVDTQRRIWFIGVTADRRWRQATTFPDSAWGHGFAINDFDGYFDTTIEVRDLESGRLIASTRLDNWYTLVEPGVLEHVTHTSGGWQQAELSRLVMTEPSSRP